MSYFKYTILGIGIITEILGLVLLALPFDPLSLQNVLTSDGSFDPLALYVFAEIETGLIVGGIVLLVIAALFFYIDKRKADFMKISDAKFLIIVIGLQLLLGLIYISNTSCVPLGDFEWYDRQAGNIADGIGVVDLMGLPTAYWGVGYPLILAPFYIVFGADIFVAQCVNLLLICCTTFITYLIGKKLFNCCVARLATLILALLPSQIFYALLPTAEIPLVLFTLLIIYLSLQQYSIRNTIISGLLFGFANHCRSVIFFYPTVLAFTRFLRDRNYKSALKYFALLLIIGELVLLPWQLRNYHHFDSFVFSTTNPGFNVLMGNNPNASGGVLWPQTFIPADVRTQILTLNEAQKDKLLFKLGVEYILSNPSHAVILAAKKLIHLYYKDSKCITYSLQATYEDIPSTVLLAMIIITEGYYYALCLSFLIAFTIMIKREGLSNRALLILSTVLYFTLIYLPFTAEGRYHMPLMPLFAIVVASSYLFEKRANPSS